MYRRFRRGHWRTMLVIEPTLPELCNLVVARLAWPACTPDRGATLVCDEPCPMVDDPDAEARKLLLT